MCEILIKIKNHTHVDSEKDRRGTYKKGMPIVVMEDGHTWGRLESKQQWIFEGNDAADWHGKSAILKVTGATVAQSLDLIAPQTNDDSGVPTTSTFRRRKWKLLLDSVPNWVKEAVQDDGEVTVTKAQIKSYIKRIWDNADFSGFD